MLCVSSPHVSKGSSLQREPLPYVRATDTDLPKIKNAFRSATDERRNAEPESLRSRLRIIVVKPNGAHKPNAIIQDAGLFRQLLLGFLGGLIVFLLVHYAREKAEDERRLGR